MDRGHDLPSEDTVRALLRVIAPGSSLSAIRPLAGSYSNHTHLIEAHPAAGQSSDSDALLRIVLRRYAEGGGDRRAKARLEFETLAWLQGHGVPAPQPLYLDEDGALLGTPGIVTAYVPGKHVMLPSDPRAWARALAAMLARIHAVPCDDQAQRFLLDANREAAWFLRAGIVPDDLLAHPEGTALWYAVRDLLPGLHQVPPAWVHLDYWPGNVLWDRGHITAVVDWEEAACGDPGIDVAYCRMCMLLDGLDRAADEFLRTYEAKMGRVLNLGF